MVRCPLTTCSLPSQQLNGKLLVNHLWCKLRASHPVAVCCMQVLFHRLVTLFPLPQRGNWAMVCGQTLVNAALPVAVVSALWVCSEVCVP